MGLEKLGLKKSCNRDPDNEAEQRTVKCQREEYVQSKLLALEQLDHIHNTKKSDKDMKLAFLTKRTKSPRLKLHIQSIGKAGQRALTFC
eukprot:10559504-Heterocapsa_arctica.AAC.1